MPTSDYFNSLDYEAQKRYIAKLTVGEEDLPDPYGIPDGMWLDDTTKWPSLEFGDLYMYLIESKGSYTKENLRAYKSLEAYNYFYNGYVRTVYYYGVSSSKFCILKAEVNPSQKAAESPHEAWVVLCKENAMVRTAHCKCMAGLGEVCSHVAALLFKVEAACRLGYNNPSCTSRPCQWNRTFKTKVTPREVCDIEFVNPANKKRKTGNVEDPLQPCARTKKAHIDYTGPQDNPNICKEKLYETVHNQQPNACLFTIVRDTWSTSESLTSPCIDDKAPNKPSHPPLTPVDHSTLCDVTNTDHEENSLPIPLTALYSDNYKCLDDASLKKSVLDMFNSITISEEECKYIERYTRSQRENSLWYKQRCGRVTASCFHDIVSRKKNSSPDNLVTRFLRREDISNIPAIKWGIDNEDKAREAYVTKMSSSHIEFKCSPAGLVISPQYPYLGASPDGFIQCECCGEGVIEIKCPFSVRDGTPEDLVGRKGSFLNDAGLIHSHKYYTQVQGQLEICRKAFCDFIVWTPNGLFTQRIYKDQRYVEKIVKKVTSFYVESMLPELMTHRLQSTSSEDVTSTNTYRAPTLYCSCRGEEHGKMILCENPTCQYGWYHFSCIGMKRAPKGSWYCEQCKHI